MRAIMTLCIFLACTQLVSAQADKRQKNFNITATKVAIQGYDPVAYFQGKPAAGIKTISHQHEGITYYFASTQNREAFKARPQYYEPQYGGWCAYAMGANGEKVTVDPETFKIIDGKLFLFYNRFFNNTLKLWNKDEQALHVKADRNWAGIYR